jgi:hypothetical protein
MSQQVSIRFAENQYQSDYESNLLSRCYDLFDSLKASLEVDNFLSFPMTTNEEELRENLEEELGEEPEGDDWEEYEERLEELLGQRGDFYPVSELIEAVKLYQDYFHLHLEETFQLTAHHQTTGQMLYEDLKELQDQLDQSPLASARLVIN